MHKFFVTMILFFTGYFYACEQGEQLQPEYEILGHNKKIVQGYEYDVKMPAFDSKTKKRIEVGTYRMPAQDVQRIQEIIAGNNNENTAYPVVTSYPVLAGWLGNRDIGAPPYLQVEWVSKEEKDRLYAAAAHVQLSYMQRLYQSISCIRK